MSFATYREKYGDKGRAMAERGRGFGKKPAWAQRQDQFYPSEVPTVVRLIPTNKREPWYTFFSKWLQVPKNDGTQGVFKRMIISNAHNGLRDIPCLLQYYLVVEENDNYTAQEQQAITVVVLEWFFKVPRVSKTNGKTYFDLVRVKGKDPKGASLDPPEYEKYEKVFGRKQYWAMWPTQVDRFMERYNALGDMCGTPGCGGAISVFLYKCPSCGGVILNLDEESATEEDIIALREDSVVCPHCNADVIAVQEYRCVKKDPYDASTFVEGCSTPTRLDPKSFNLDIVVRAVPAGNGKAIVIDKARIASDPTGKIDPQMLIPLPFDEFLGQMSLAEQAKQMGRANPFPESDEKLIKDFFIAGPRETDGESAPWDDEEGEEE